MQHARDTQFHHLEHTTQLLCGQSTLAKGQGSEHYLVVAFYDKLNAAVVLFFDTRIRTGLIKKKEHRLARSINLSFRYIDDILSLIIHRFGDFIYTSHQPQRT